MYVGSDILSLLLCFMKPILGNRYVRSRGFIVSESMETHPRSEIADVPTSPCPILDNLGCPDPHPAPQLRCWLHRSPPLPLRTDPQLLRWQPGACDLAAPSSGQVQSVTARSWTVNSDISYHSYCVTRDDWFNSKISFNCTFGKLCGKGQRNPIPSFWTLF